MMYRPVHPGRLIESDMEAMDLGIRDLADSLGISECHLIDLLDGKVRLTEDVAEKLEEHIGSTKEHWMRMQYAYDRRVNED